MVETLLFHVEKTELYGSLDTKKLGYCNPPMGLVYLAAVLERAQRSVRLVDLQLTRDPLGLAREVLREEGPRFVGITCTTPDFSAVCDVAGLVKELDRRTTVLVGGPHPSAVPEDVLKNENIDYVVVGEGETTLLELIRGDDPRGIRGLAYRERGTVRTNPPRPLIKNLDSLPFPAYHQLDIPRYGEPHRPKVMSIIGSRGCPYSCIFCANNVVHRQVRARSPENVVDEIEFLTKEHDVVNFAFFDEVFTLRRTRCIRICKEIIERKLSINWFCASRVDVVDKEMLTIMKGAGCQAVEYGVESGNQRILDLIKKGTTLKQIEDAVRWTREVGMQPNGLFMIGHPYETEDTINETIELAKRLPFEYAIFSITMPLPGTELWTWCHEEKGIRLLTHEWEKFKSYEEPVIELPDVPPERLALLQKKAFRTFYFRPSYVVRRFIDDPVRLINDAKKTFVMFDFLR